MSSDSERPEETSPVLPVELICKIVDCHYDFRYDRTLFQCALVNRTLSYHARSIIFGHITLGHPDRVEALGRLIRADPALGPLVKELAFQRSLGPSAVFAPPRDAGAVVADMLPWQRFEGLHKLSFSAVRMPSLAALGGILDGVPGLECLEVALAQVFGYGDDGADRRLHPSASSSEPSESTPPPTSTEERVTEKPRRCPNLKSLTVLCANFDPAACTRLLFGSPSPNLGAAGLETLVLDNFRDLPRAEDYFAWTPLLRASSKTLTRVELSVFSTPPGASFKPAEDAGGPQSYPARLFASLAECAALRRIALGYRVHSSRQPDSAAEDGGAERGFREVFDALCAHLARAPHPELEELTLSTLYGTSEPFAAAACARFADALLGRRGEEGGLEPCARARPCPRFRRFTLRVRVEVRVEGLWAAVASERDRAKAEMSRRWKEAFGRFEEEGVELTVNNLF